jgi:pilin accessory protein (PilO)
MATQIVQIGRHRFLCGLFWQSLSRRHELRAEATELAARLRFDALVLRIDRSFAGAGFASTREGAQLGLPSLGALVSKAIATEGAFYDGRQQPAPNWLGAFRLPDERWAYFAVRDGAFLPNGDWVGSSEEVFERLHSDYSLGGWNVVIGDPQIEVQGFHNFYPRSIENMIPRRGGRTHLPRWVNLMPVSRRVQWRRIALAAAVLTAVGLLAWGGYRYREHKLEVARQLAFERAREQLRLHPPHPVAPPEAPHPWAAAPLPSTFVSGCVDHFVLIAPGGWQLDSYACRETNVSYSWSREDSNVAMLVAAQPRAVIDTSGNHATLVVPVSLAAGGDEAIDVHGVRLRMLSAFQLLGVSLTFSLQRPATPPKSLAADALGQLGGKRDAAPPWQTWRLSANLGDLSPTSVIRYLDQPGVRLDKVSYQSGQWTIEGVLYEK